MAKAKHDRRPVRSNSKAEGPRREIPAGMFKCQLHGATLPVSEMQPGVPKEWQCCRPCWKKSQDTSDRHKNPGTAAGLEEVAR